MYVSQVGGMHPTGMFLDVVIVIVTARNEVWGKVMFSQVFACPRGMRVGFPACIQVI